MGFREAIDAAAGNSRMLGLGLDQSLAAVSPSRPARRCQHGVVRMKISKISKMLGLALAAGSLITFSLAGSAALACEGHDKGHAKGDCAGKAGCGHDHATAEAGKADAKKESTGDAKKAEGVKKGKGKKAKTVAAK